ncbi:MAG: lysophospholipid acyltransferase family protein [Lachnospiraceae bacterium]|nr:lysophospholipid acyltransferase family protein [Lachnospiraceae bacterium]
MIRFILVVLLLLGFLVFSIPLLIGEWLVRKGSRRRQQEHSLAVVKAVFRMLVRITGSTVIVKGKERIPEGAVLYVGNHRSYFDILVGYITVPGLTGFVAKKEMLRYPILSNWMRDVNCLFLDRKDIKAGLKTILDGIEKVRNGISIWIFPEGTRNRSTDPLEMLPFKEGSLKIAEKSGCPVVPVAITGSSEIFEQHIPFMRPSTVTIEFGEPFYVKELPLEDRKHVGAYTQKRIAEMLTNEQQARRA